MQETECIEKGWEFFAKLLGSEYSAKVGSDYVSDVNKAIDALNSRLNAKEYRTGDPKTVKGYMAEEYQAGLYNVRAVAAGKPYRAIRLASQKKNSVDIAIVDIRKLSRAELEDTKLNYDSIVRKADKKYQIKIYNNTRKSVDQLSAIDKTTGKARYENDIPMMAADQNKALNRGKNKKYILKKCNASDPEIASAYRHTNKTRTDHIEFGKISADGKTKAQYESMAKKAQKQKNDVRKDGITARSEIKAQYVFENAIKAGVSAAVITAIMQTAPEIFKAVDYLVQNGEVDIDQVKTIGEKAISSSAEGFLHGSIACALQILCAKGAFGVALKEVNPSTLGALTAIVLDTVKNGLLVAAGKMSARQMGNEFVDSAVVSMGYIAGLKAGKIIGGAIGQAIGFEAPFIGYLIGSLIGCSIAAAYNIGKKKLISFCVDSGFACFGLVEQDYVLPEEALKKMGIDYAPITCVSTTRASVTRVAVTQAPITRASINTIDMFVIKRGIIGVNRVGYIS